MLKKLKLTYKIFLFLMLYSDISSLDLHCQAYQQIVLVEDIKSCRLIGDNIDPCFIAVQKENGSFFISSVHNQSEKIYLHIDEPRFIFIADSNYCILTTLLSNKSYSNVTEIKFYDRQGNFIKKLFYKDKEGFLVNVSFSNSTNSIYFADLEMKRVNIYRYNDDTPIISIEHSQPTPPSRLELPIFLISKYIYITFDNEYLIQVFSLTGEKLFHFTNKLYTHKPYNDEEIKLLPDLVRMSYRSGINYPPIIKKIEAIADNRIIVTRFPRPGSNQVFVDIFNDKGDYFHSYHFTFNKNEKLVDVYSSKHNYYCLAKNKEISKYIIYIYELKL